MNGNDVAAGAQECFERVATGEEREEVALLFLRSEFAAGAERMAEVIEPHDPALAGAYRSLVAGHPSPVSAAEAFAAVTDRAVAESFLVTFAAGLAAYGPEAVAVLSSCPRLSTVLRHGKLRDAVADVPDDVISALADMLDRFEISGSDCLRAAGIEPVSTGSA